MKFWVFLRHIFGIADGKTSAERMEELRDITQGLAEIIFYLIALYVALEFDDLPRRVGHFYRAYNFYL